LPVYESTHMCALFLFLIKFTETRVSTSSY